MKLDLKQPRYVIPILILPFLCFFFYLWQDTRSTEEKVTVKEEGLKQDIGEASAQVRKKQLDDKLNAYRNTYKESDGYTAVVPLGEQNESGPLVKSAYSDQEKYRLDSIDQAMKSRYAPSPASPGRTYPAYVTTTPPIARPRNKYAAEDKALADALNKLTAEHSQKQNAVTTTKPAVIEKDPMELFRAQMAYVDSVSKANDPDIKAEQARANAVKKAEQESRKHPVLEVQKANAASGNFNTVLPDKKDVLITAIIDENVTGYADSRIRIRLLEEIRAGTNVIPQGTLLFAFINSFSGQRVGLEVRSVLLGDKILPVKLTVYDQDGQPGLYVPSSAFREFTKELSGNSMQGVQIQGNSATGTQFLMSTFDKVFQSTSSAIANAIRKNKAKIKFSTHVYLVDQHALQNQSSKQ